MSVHTRDQQTFSARDQIVIFFTFVDHVVSVTLLSFAVVT